MYESQRDASMRLSGTIIRLSNGRPIYVVDAKTKSMLQYQELTKDGLDREGEPKKGRITDGKFDLSPVPLGYINYNGSACYMQRIPARKYKQGLSSTNLSCNNQAILTREVIQSGSMYRCIIGSYPSIEDCFATKDIMDVKSIAFSREWAIRFRGGKNYLMYKGRKIVGTINEDNEYELMDEYRYLTESLEGVLA